MTAKAFPRRAGPPAAEPLTLAEVRPHLKEYAGDAEVDAYITSLIPVARRMCEERTERTLITTPWTLSLDAFPDAIELPQPPIIEITAVRYLDPAGSEQTINLADLYLDRASEPGWLVPGPGKAWPATLNRINAVTVEYTAGYGATGASVPEPLRHWMLAAIQHMHNERGWDVPDAFAIGLLNPYRLYGI